MPDGKPKFDKRVLDDGTEIVTLVKGEKGTEDKTPKPEQASGDKA